MRKNEFIPFIILAIVVVIVGTIATVAVINSDLPDFMKYLLLK